MNRITRKQFIQKISQDDNPSFFGNVFNFKIDEKMNFFSKNISFHTCDFKKELNFKRVEIAVDISFLECEFRENVQFENCNFKVKKLDFSRTTFHEEFKFNGTEIQQVLSFRKRTDSFRYFFINPQLNNLVFFDNTTFSKGALFDSCKTHGAISFKDAIFEGKSSFNNSIFFDKVFFDETLFEQKALFQKCMFHNNTSFGNTKFLKLADFYRAKFKKLQIFYKTDFNKNAVFSRVIFNENVCFPYSTGESNMIFRHAIFTKGLDMSLTIINGQINFFNVELINFHSVPDPEENEEGAKVYDKHIEKGEITHKNKRETFRLIKDALINQNNVIDSLTYKSLEMASLDNELNGNKDSKCRDKTILFFAKYSNDFGSSWDRALLFITISGLFFYSLSLFAVEEYPFTIGWGGTWDAIGFYFGNFFEFLNPTHKIDYLGMDYELGFWFKLPNFLGRIFVAYGIYQLIVSFRKFSKK